MSSPSQGEFGILSLKLATCWYVFSISVNVMSTIAIITRLLWRRKEINDILGKEHSKAYTGIVAMLVESASLYSIFGIIFIGTYLRKNYVSEIVLPTLGNLEVSILHYRALADVLVKGICPLLIIYRVAIGRGWTQKTMRQVNSTISSIAFRDGEGRAGPGRAHWGPGLDLDLGPSSGPGQVGVRSGQDPGHRYLSK